MVSGYRKFTFSILSFVFICYLISILSCKQKSDEAGEIPGTGKTELPSDFIAFYTHFHQDSAYQVSHVTFPLSGILQDTAGRDSAVTWVAETWTVHNAVTPDDLWSVDFTIPMEGVILEFIHARNAGYYMERRFAKMGNSWNLIYYAGLRSVKNSEEVMDSLIESGELEIEE